MPRLTQAGIQTLAGKNFTTHTRVYVDGILQMDTSTGSVAAPVLGYQINRSRKLGAAQLTLKVANPEGGYSYRKQADPIFGYGNKIRVQEGLTVNGSIEWFTRFTGVIVSQVASNMGGRPSLTVNAMDNMKLLLDYLPDELYYCPTIVKVTGEVLTPVSGGSVGPEGDFMHYKGKIDNLPWVDIPYPVFYKSGTKIKENYEVDLINGEVYFGEKMWSPQWMQATKSTNIKYTVPALLQPNPLVRRSFTLVRYGAGGGIYDQQVFQNSELPAGITAVCSGYTVTFSQDPFSDLVSGSNWEYTNKQIFVTTGSANQVTADYWYYDGQTNLGESVIRDLAFRAGFKPEQIILEDTGVSLEPLRLTNLTIQSGFHALQKIKQQLSPNYIITCDCEGNLRGYFASQMAAADYEMELIKRIEAPVSEENLYTTVVAHGIDLNPNDLGKTAVAENLGPNFSGNTIAIFNKNVDDQVTWRWRQVNNDTPPEFPIDLLKITLAEAKKIEEISILVGNFDGGTIQQSISVQVSEDGSNWFYIDQSSRGITGASSQWVSVKGGELKNRKIKCIKIIAESGFNWIETHTYSESGGWFLNPKISVHTDNYYNWFFAIKEIQVWEENTIAVTSSLANCIGIGDGVNKFFTIPNTPIVASSEIIYVEGQRLGPDKYTLDYATGQIRFEQPPLGLITANYAVTAKNQASSQTNSDLRYLNNITIISPPGSVVFTGGEIAVNSPQYKLLKRVGLKKNALKTDNYLNSFADTKLRGEEMLQEIARLEETLDVDVVYRPDVDICQTVSIFDAMLGIAECYFIEEITESKQGYKPSLNIKVSNYSA